MRSFMITLLVAVSCLGFLMGTEAKSRRARQNAMSSAEKTKLLQIIRKLAKEAGHNKSDTIGETEQEGVCYTKKCLEASIEYLEAMNFNAKPCDKNGFGEFACHRRIHRLPSDEYQSKFGNKSMGIKWDNDETQFAKDFLSEAANKADSPSFRSAKVAYSQCLNRVTNWYYSTPALYNISESLGGWPLLTGQPLKENYDPFKVLAFISQFTSTSLFFDIQSRKTADGTQEIILDKGTLFYLEDNPTLTRKYKEIISKTRDAWTTNKYYWKYWATMSSEQSVDEQINKMVAVRNDFVPGYVQTGFGKPLAKMTIAKLTKYTLSVEWLTFFKKAFEYSHVEITPETIVHVNKPYLKTILPIIDGMEKTKTPVANLLQYEIWSKWSPYTYINSQTDVDCFYEVKHDFGATLSKEYLKRTKFPSTNEVKKDLTSMVDLLLESLMEAIRNSSVLTPAGRTEVIEKFENIGKFIGYAPWLDDDTKFNRFHDKLEILKNASESYLKNKMSVEAWKIGFIRDNLEKQNDSPHYWELNSFIIPDMGASYSHAANAIQIPHAFTTPPNYDNALPGYYNFGSLGMVIGHEFGHALDTIGILFDKDGNFKRKNWLDPKSRENYINWTNEIKNSLGGSKIHHHGLPEGVNGTLHPDATINDDIADTVGLGLAIRAYRKWIKQQPGQKDVKLPGLEQWTDEQLFYTRYTNYWCSEMSDSQIQNYWQGDHSPDYNRATVPLLSSKEFAQAFNCTKTVEKPKL